MPTVEFASKQAADAARERHAEHLCPDDDRRLKTVRFRSDTPDAVLDRATGAASEGFAERETIGQSPLTDGEKRRIDFSKDGVNVLKLRSIKAIAENEGVDDWLAYHDPKLTVDEHREVMARAVRDESGAGEREESTDQKHARAHQTAEGEGCDHARGHCENGDLEACEYLTDHCGMAPDDLESVGTGAVVPFEDLPGPTKGALRRSWSGYKIAVRRLADLLDEVAAELDHAERAARAISAIEAGISDVKTARFEALGGHHERLGKLADRHEGILHGQPGETLASREPAQRSDAATDAEVRVAVEEIDPQESMDRDVAENRELYEALADRRHETDTEGTLFEHAENAPSGGETSDDHRRAQNNGYLESGRRGFADGVSARDGLGQFAATGGEKTLDRFERSDDTETEDDT